MDSEELQAILAQRSPAVVAVVKTVLADRLLLLFDGCVLDYIIKMLEGQCDAESYLADEIIIETLVIYFQEFALATDEPSASKLSTSLVNAMEAKGITQKPKLENKKLVSAISIGKQYEDNVKRAATMGLAKVSVNTNDEWTWDAQRNAAKDDRRRK